MPPSRGTSPEGYPNLSIYPSASVTRAPSPHAPPAASLPPAAAVPSSSRPTPTVTPTQNTRALLTSLEALRDSLSDRVHQLSLAVERLRGQAGELERALATGDGGEVGRELVGLLEGPGEGGHRANEVGRWETTWEVEVRVVGPDGTTGQIVPSHRRPLPHPASNPAPVPRHPDPDSPTSLADDMASLSRPITRDEIHALLDRAAQAVPPSHASEIGGEAGRRARNVENRIEAIRAEVGGADLRRRGSVHGRRAGRVGEEGGRREEGRVMMGMERDGTITATRLPPEQPLRRSRTSTSRALAENRSCGMPPTNIRARTTQPQPIVVRSSVPSPASTITPDRPSVPPPAQATRDNMETMPLLDTDHEDEHDGDSSLTTGPLFSNASIAIFPAQPNDNNFISPSSPVRLPSPSPRRIPPEPSDMIVLAFDTVPTRTGERLQPPGTTPPWREATGTTSRPPRDPSLTWRGMNVQNRLNRDGSASTNANPDTDPSSFLSSFPVLREIFESSNPPPVTRQVPRGARTMDDEVSAIVHAQAARAGATPRSARAEEAELLRRYARDIVRSRTSDLQRTSSSIGVAEAGHGREVDDPVPLRHLGGNDQRAVTASLERLEEDRRRFETDRAAARASIERSRQRMRELGDLRRDMALVRSFAGRGETASTTAPTTARNVHAAVEESSPSEDEGALRGLRSVVREREATLDDLERRVEDMARRNRRLAEGMNSSSAIGVNGEGVVEGSGRMLPAGEGRRRERDGQRSRDLERRARVREEVEAAENGRAQLIPGVETPGGNQDKDAHPLTSSATFSLVKEDESQQDSSSWPSRPAARPRRQWVYRSMLDL